MASDRTPSTVLRTRWKRCWVSEYRLRFIEKTSTYLCLCVVVDLGKLVGENRDEDCDEEHIA